MQRPRMFRLFVLFALVSSHTALGASLLSGSFSRNKRSLADTFPFNLQEVVAEDQLGDNPEFVEAFRSSVTEDHGDHGARSGLLETSRSAGGEKHHGDHGDHHGRGDPHHGLHDDHHGHHGEASERNGAGSELLETSRSAGGEEHHQDLGDHPGHQEKASEFANRDQRQGTDVSLPDIAAAGLDSDGKRCIDKVEMVEETEYDDVVQCDHSYDKRCHTTYITTYDSQQEEECEENFWKKCFIEYEQIAFNETATVCRTPLVKDCDAEGPQICRTEYESECWTRQEVHDVEDDVVSCKTEVEEKCEDNTSGYTTNTKCSKWPKEVCSVSKKPVKKYTPITGCTKEPRELCTYIYSQIVRRLPQPL